MAARGTIVPAEVAFDAALEEAERAQLWLLAAFSLRERIKHCGGTDSSFEAKFEQVIQKLKSPRAAVEALF